MVRAKRFLIQHKKCFIGASTIAGIVISIIILYAFVIIGISQFDFDPDDYKTNLYTEVFGVLFSVFVSVVIIGGWSYSRERQQLRARLKREAGSRSNDIAISAVEWLRDKKWLIGDKGLLKGADLRGANLNNADLYKVNLQCAVLQNARLQECQMWKADLVEANLRFVNLQGARLWEANLQCAKLWKANLKEAKLWRANLQRADLLGAYLQGATLKEAKFNGATTLPDGEMYSSDTEMDRYTNPNHCGFSKTLDDINEIRNSM